MEFLLWLQEIRTPFLENAALIVSLLCDKILIMLIFCWFFWCRDKRWAYGLALSFAVSGLFVQGAKIVFRVDRPFVRDLRIKPVAGALETATGYSFPSGHTQVATSLLGFTCLSVRKYGLKIISLLVILLVMLSRMLLGVHTPLDVTVSFAVTGVTALLVKLVLDRKEGFWWLPGFFLSLAVFIYSIYLVVSGTASYGLASDATATSIIGMVFFVCYYLESRFIKFDPAATFSGKSGFGHQLLKFAVGFAGVLVIYFGIGLFDNAVADCVKYAAVFTWICALYPLVIKKLCKRV